MLVTNPTSANASNVDAVPAPGPNAADPQQDGGSLLPDPVTQLAASGDLGAEIAALAQSPRDRQAGPTQAGPDGTGAEGPGAAQAEPGPDGEPQARPRPAARPRAGQPTARTGAAASGPLRVRTLGGAVVEFGEAALTAAHWGYAKPRELMFLLVSSPPMTKDQIAAALWPDLSRQQLGNALHTALRELRRALGDPGWVVYADGHYRFDRSRPHECDVTEFEDALLAARRARPPEAALPELQRAIGVYGGDFLDGMSAGEWALVRRDELRRAFESALLAAGLQQTAAGRHQAAATLFRRAVAHEPLNETAHRELMNSGPAWARRPGCRIPGADRAAARTGRCPAGPGDHGTVPSADCCLLTRLAVPPSPPVPPVPPCHTRCTAD